MIKNIKFVGVDQLIFAGIEEIVNVARVVQMAERVAILKAGNGRAFQFFGKVLRIRHDFLLKKLWPSK